jgi:hypothetical protein
VRSGGANAPTLGRSILSRETWGEMETSFEGGGGAEERGGDSGVAREECGCQPLIWCVGNQRGIRKGRWEEKIWEGESAITAVMNQGFREIYHETMILGQWTPRYAMPCPSQTEALIPNACIPPCSMVESKKTPRYALNKTQTSRIVTLRWTPHPNWRPSSHQPRSSFQYLVSPPC